MWEMCRRLLVKVTGCRFYRLSTDPDLEDLQNVDCVLHEWIIPPAPVPSQRAGPVP
jgi:hypothetical protein